MLYSPINYLGNKSRIVRQLLPYIPHDTSTIHEIFCGSAVFSLSSQINDIYLNDIDHHTIDLIKYFAANTAEEIIQTTDELISRYGLTNTFYSGKSQYIEQKHEGLSRYNKEAFNKLKSDYNHDNDISKLFVLIIYGFNHFIRFNSKGEFNVPVGKTDYVESLRIRTKEYCEAIQNKNLVITNCDFREASLYTAAEESALFYFDPPYLITQAPYNSFWNTHDESDLLDLLDELNHKGYRFLLSNVVESNGKTNSLLIKWMRKYNIHPIQRRYLNSNYQKKNLSDAQELIIFNYGEDKND